MNAALAEQRKANVKKTNKYRNLSRSEVNALMADAMDVNSRRILRAIRIKDLSSTPLSQLGGCLQYLVQGARLLRGESTANVSVASRIDAVVRVQALADKLQGALGSSATSIPASINVSSSSDSALEVVDCQEVACLDAAPATVPAPRKRGRPRKVQPPATPPPSDQP